MNLLPMQESPDGEAVRWHRLPVLFVPRVPLRNRAASGARTDFPAKKSQFRIKSLPLPIIRPAGAKPFPGEAVLIEKT